MKKILTFAASLALAVLPCGGQIITGGTVDNAAVNAAIEEDVAATQAVLNVTSNVITPAGLVSDAKRHSNGVVSGTSVTCASASFAASGEPGKTIRIEGAGTAATVTLTRTGTIVTGSTGLTGGSSGGYPPNSIVAITISGGGGTGATAHGLTNSSGQVSSVDISATGTGYTSDPTATFPSADHITTIATRVSATSITITDAAPTAITSNAVFFYGTNNSTAIQNAINDAYASADTKTVRVPAGRYLANVKMRTGVTLEGAFSGQDSDPAWSDTKINNGVNPTVMTLLMPATRAPVIDADSSYGDGYAPSMTILRKLMLAGSNVAAAGTKKRGYGVRYGIANGQGVGYVGQGFIIEDIMTTGFEYGVSINRTANFAVRLSEASGCAVGFNFGGSTLLATAGVGGTDGVNFSSCATHGSPVGARFNYAKNATSADCDFGTATNAIVTETSNLFIPSMNVEGCTGDIIKKTNGQLVVGTALVTGAASSPLISEYGSSASSTVMCAAGFGLPFGASSPLNTVWRGTTSVIGYPNIGRSTAGMILKYSSTDWASIREAVRVSDLTITAPEAGLDQPISERFFTPLTSPYGTHGWTLTAVSGSLSPTVAHGSIKIAFTSDASSNVGRLNIPTAFLWGPSSRKSVFLAKVEYAYGLLQKARIGNYSLESSFTPTNGYGFRIDPTPIAATSLTSTQNGTSYVITSLGDTVWTDIGATGTPAVGTVFVKSGTTGTGTGTAGLAYVWLENINAGTVTGVETKVLVSATSADLYYEITKCSQGLIGVIKNANGVPLSADTWAASGSASLAPCLISGATATQWQSTFLKYFSTNLVY